MSLLIFARGGRQAQLEPGVRSEIVRAFHAGQTKGTAADMNKCTPCTLAQKNQVLTPCVFEARRGQ